MIGTLIGRFLAGLARLISGASVRRIAPPSDARQRVYFGNHSSHLDFVVIWSALSKEERTHTRPVAGSDYWSRGIVRRYLSSQVFGAILIDRAQPGMGLETARHSIERIAEGMGSDKSIIVFPEGTRSLNGELLPFKSGLYRLCQLKPELELVPVYLDNMTRILPKGEVLPVPLLSRVTFGPPMQAVPGEAKEVFLERARQALLALRAGDA
jgi:1-acyl-sn-glycerol-3-phosphate acyltransferase